jgi:hypothetical protein
MIMKDGRSGGGYLFGWSCTMLCCTLGWGYCFFLSVVSMMIVLLLLVLRKVSCVGSGIGEFSLVLVGQV